VENKTQIKRLLTEDFAKGLETVEMALVVDSTHVNEFYLLKCRHNENEKDRNRNVINSGDYQIEKNRIIKAVLDLVDKIWTEIYQADEIIQQNTKVEKEKFDTPRIDLDFKYAGGYKSPLRLSRNNEVDESGAVDLRGALFIFEIGWKYKLWLVNNSSYSAFYPKIFSKNSIKFDITPPIDRLEPIKPLSRLDYGITYWLKVESTGEMATDLMNDKFPTGIDDLELLLEYQNEKGKSFYTHLCVNNGDVESKILKERPNGF